MSSKPGFLKIIWLAIRPKTLLASITPVLVGSSLAISKLNLEIFFLTLFAAVLLQIVANLANDVIDFEKGADTSQRLGPLRVTQAGYVTPLQMKFATAAVIFLALLTGLRLAFYGGLPIIIIGILSIVFAILYTAGPFPLAYTGLGDIFVLLFFGPVSVVGTFYLQTLRVNIEAFLASIPLGMLATAILVVNNLRDIDEDKTNAKNTLAVRFGKGFARMEFALLLLVSALFPIIFYLTIEPSLIFLLPTLSIVPAVSLIKTVYRNSSRQDLNHTLAATARLLLLYGLLSSIAFII